MNTKQKKQYSVSVIIPVFGVEKYIERSARSLFEQTLSDIEFIFVDDCCQDNSIEILKRVMSEYPNRGDSVRIIHHDKNLGLPYARRTGLMHAQGLFVANCDSDDWVDLDLYERMYNNAQKYHSDIVVCDCKNTNGDSYSVLSGGIETSAKECVKLMLYRKMWWSMCNKIFKRELFQEPIQFPDNYMGEDMCLCLQLMYHASKVSYVKNSFYNYYLPQSHSIHDKEKLVGIYEQFTSNLALLIDSFHSLFHETQYDKGFVFLDFYKQSLLEGCLDDLTIRRRWRAGIKEFLLPVMMDNNVLFKMRAKAFLILIHAFPF